MGQVEPSCSDVGSAVNEVFHHARFVSVVQVNKMLCRRAISLAQALSARVPYRASVAAESDDGRSAATFRSSG